MAAQSLSGCPAPAPRTISHPHSPAELRDPVRARRPHSSAATCRGSRPPASHPGPCLSYPARSVLTASAGILERARVRGGPCPVWTDEETTNHCASAAQSGVAVAGKLSGVNAAALGSPAKSCGIFVD